MFILPMPDSTKMISFRADDEMTECITELATRLRVSRSTLIRIAVSKLISEARSANPINFSEIFNVAQ